MSPETWQQIEAEIASRRRRLLAAVVRFSARAIVEETVSPTRIFAAVDSLAHPVRSRRAIPRTLRDAASDAADDLVDALSQVRRIVEASDSDSPAVRLVRREVSRSQRAIDGFQSASVASDAELERLFQGSEA